MEIYFHPRRRFKVNSASLWFIITSTNCIIVIYLHEYLKNIYLEKKILGKTCAACSKDILTCIHWSMAPLLWKSCKTDADLQQIPPQFPPKDLSAPERKLEHEEKRRSRKRRRRGKQRMWPRRKETIKKKMQERSGNLRSVWHPLWHTSPVCIASGGSSPAGHTCETNIALLHSGNTEWETKKRMKQFHFY